MSWLHFNFNNIHLTNNVLSVNPCNLSNMCAKEGSICNWTHSDGWSCSCRPGYVHEPSTYQHGQPYCTWAGNAMRLYIYLYLQTIRYLRNSESH